MQLDITEAEVRTEVVRPGLTELYDRIKPYYNATTSNGVKLTAAWWEAETGIPAKRIVDGMRRRSESGANAASKRDQDREAVTRALRNRPEAVAEAIKQLPPERQHEIVRKVIETPRPAISKADRKAADAGVKDAFEPIRQSLNHMQVLGVADRLADLLRNLPRDLDNEARNEVQAAIDDVVLAHMEFMAQFEVQS